jgi:hypothetical protein
VFVPPFPLTARLSGPVLALLFLPGCNALNPLCGSARPMPVLNSISPPTQTFSRLPASFTLTANGGNFVPSSVVVFNGATLATSVNSHSVLTVTIKASMISKAGRYNVKVHTPGGTTADVGCSSGGDSAVRVLTVN